MALLKTCRPCAKVADCDRRRALTERLAGSGVLTVTHRCPEIHPLYRPGQQVWAHTFEMSHSEYAQYDDDHAPDKHWYPGTFLKVYGKTNARGLVVVRAGAIPEGDIGDCPFRPMREGRLFAVCKLAWKDIRPRDGEDAFVCPRCSELPAITGGCGFGYERCEHATIANIKHGSANPASTAAASVTSDPDLADIDDEGHPF